MKKTIVLAFVLLASMAQAAQPKMAINLAGNALRGSEGVGGGDEVGLDFQRALQDVIAEVQASMPNLYVMLEENNFSVIAANAKIVVADDGLGVEYLAYIQDSVAANFPEAGTIMVNRQRWTAIQEYKVKKAIAFHEVLSLAKLEETGSYAISSKYLANQGMTTEYLNLALHPASKSRSGGLAPRGIPRYEKSETQRKEEQLALVETKIEFVCESYSKKAVREKIVSALEIAHYQVNSYLTMLDFGQPDYIQASAAAEELRYILKEGVKAQFGTPNHYASAIKAYCR